MNWRTHLDDPEMRELFESRNTGLTTNLLKNTPEGVTYIVHSSNLRGLIEEYCRQIGKEDIHVIGIDQCNQWLKSRRTPIAIDHACFYDVIRNPDLYPVLDNQEEIYFNGREGAILIQRRDRDGTWSLDEVAGA